jgi:acetyl-CoA/propionyl-CoA carboxylase biotin carboxyl carrier protein
MLRALGEFRVEGIPTTIPFHEWVLKTPEFGNSSHTTTWVEQALEETPLPAEPALPARGPDRKPVPEEILVEVDGRRLPVRIYDDRLPTAPLPPGEHAARHHGHVHNVIAAPMQGTILKVLVETGREIEPGEVICVLEAMKMENHITATMEGTVTELPIEPGQVVETGQTLAVID